MSQILEHNAFSYTSFFPLMILISSVWFLCDIDVEPHSRYGTISAFCFLFLINKQRKASVGQIRLSSVILLHFRCYQEAKVYLYCIICSDKIKTLHQTK